MGQRVVGFSDNWNPNALHCDMEDFHMSSGVKMTCDKIPLI